MRPDRFACLPLNQPSQRLSSGLTAAPGLVVHDARLLSLWSVDAVQPDLRIADPDGIAVNDASVAFDNSGRLGSASVSQGQAGGGDEQHGEDEGQTHWARLPRQSGPVLIVVERWYDFREVGHYSGNVGEKEFN